MKKCKIFYVEDEPFLAKIVCESLESRGFELDWVSDGQLALKRIPDLDADICVLDVMLPHVDGFRLGKAIKKQQPGLPIIFLTAKDQTADVLEGFRSGGNDYIKKPFSVEELIVRIHNLLQLVGDEAKAATKNGQPVQIGRYRFLPIKHELHLAGKVRKLSHRETQLLSYLAAHQNHQQIDRRELLKAVWGDDSFFNSRNLDVYIKKLRDYLQEDPAVRIITLKGVGYQFVTY